MKERDDLNKPPLTLAEIVRRLILIWAALALISVIATGVLSSCGSSEPTYQHGQRVQLSH